MSPARRSIFLHPLRRQHFSRVARLCIRSPRRTRTESRRRRLNFVSASRRRRRRFAAAFASKPPSRVVRPRWRPAIVSHRSKIIVSIVTIALVVPAARIALVMVLAPIVIRSVRIMRRIRSPSRWRAIVVPPVIVAAIAVIVSSTSAVVRVGVVRAAGVVPRAVRAIVLSHLERQRLTRFRASRASTRHVVEPVRDGGRRRR